MTDRCAICTQKELALKLSAPGEAYQRALAEQTRHRAACQVWRMTGEDVRRSVERPLCEGGAHEWRRVVDDVECCQVCGVVR